MTKDSPMNSIEELILDVATRSSGDADAVRHEQYGDGLCLESDSMGGVPLGEDWLFRGATDDEAQTLLKAFLSGKLNVGCGLSAEFARLIAEKGYLVGEQLKQEIEKTDWASYGTQQFCLAGLHFLPNGRQLTLDLLKAVPEDWRNGLFTSIWKEDAPDIRAALLERFNKWTLDSCWGRSSGEGGWLGVFIAKWLTEGTVDIRDLDQLSRWYYTNIVMPR